MTPDDKPAEQPPQETPPLELTLAGITRAYLRGDLTWETYRAYERAIETKQREDLHDETN